MSKTYKNQTVAWIMSDEKILKIEELDKTYDIDDKVFKFMEGKELLDKEDFKVDVEIDESKGENGTIVKLVTENNKSEKKEKKEEPKQQKETKEEPVSTKNTQTVTKELTVAGVSVKNKGVTFKEEEKVWYTLSDEVDAQTFKDTMTGNKGEFVISETEKGNDIIVSFVVKEEKKSSDTGPSEYTDPVQVSIEAQASTNSASLLVGKLVESGKLELKDVDKFIEERAKKNHALIQALKNSI